MHHIAIATKHLNTMISFYSSLPGIYLIRENKYSDGTLRSVWYGIKDSESIIMLEKEDFSKGAHALVLDRKSSGLTRESLINHLTDKLNIAITDSTTHTIYIQDPDGNQLGYSDYPIPFPVP